jgi:hypothetical protein
MLTGQAAADYRTYLHLIRHEEAFAERAEAEGRISAARGARAAARRYREQAEALRVNLVG